MPIKATTECVRPPTGKQVCVYSINAKTDSKPAENVKDTPGASSSNSVSNTANDKEDSDGGQGTMGEQNGDGESENETAKVKIITNPSAPTQEEIDKHNILHLPYRTWCPHCVRGKGRDDAHAATNREHKIPTLSIDYAFLSGKHKSGITFDEEKQDGGAVW